MNDPTENALRTTIQAAPPNTEWWKDDLVECMDGRCPWTGPRTMLEDGGCPECGSLKRRMRVLERGQWWYWSCSPGCLPDGEPMGPFATEADALEDARDGLD